MCARFMETMWRFKLSVKCTIDLSIFIPIAQVLFYRLHYLFKVVWPFSPLYLFIFNLFIYFEIWNAEPINIFQGSYSTDTPPIRLSYHHGNHYNSLVDPRRLTVGAGLGFSSLQGVSGHTKFFLFKNLALKYPPKL